MTQNLRNRSQRVVSTALFALLLGSSLVTSMPAGARDQAQPSPAERADQADSMRVVRKAWDLVFWRPVFFAQLIVGTAALPIALPITALVGDWRDTLDACVTGPFELTFQRPLGQ